MNVSKRLDEFIERQGIVSAEFCKLLDQVEEMEQEIKRVKKLNKILSTAFNTKDRVHNALNDDYVKRRKENEVNKEINRNLANTNHDYKIQNEKLMGLLKESCYLLFREQQYNHNDLCRLREFQEAIEKYYSTGETLGGKL